MRKRHGYFPIIEKYFYATTNDLLAHLDEINIHDEAVLIKGARVFKFERVMQALQLKTHQTTLQVDLAALIHNLHYFKKLLKPESKIMAMVKAMSYGLGDAELINELCYHQVDYLPSTLEPWQSATRRAPPFRHCSSPSKSISPAAEAGMASSSM